MHHAHSSPSRETSPIIVIAGPTSSGKSSLAIEVAQKYDGEIISADSRQVYRGMDIGSGKVTKQEQLEARHHLIDIVDPNEEYNISHFLKDANRAINDIVHRGKIPIICGGSGFWIQSLIEEAPLPQVAPNPELRIKLATHSKESLFEELHTLDPVRASTIDRNNPHRLTRAIEIAKAHKESEASSMKSSQENSARENHDETNVATFEIPQKIHNAQSKIYNTCIIALSPPKNILDTKIRLRLDARLHEGMLEEVTRLHEEGVSWERLEAFGLEYRWCSRFLRNEIPFEHMKERLSFEIIHYAKRQITWLRRWDRQWKQIEREIHWAPDADTGKLFVHNFLQSSNKHS